MQACLRSLVPLAAAAILAGCAAAPLSYLEGVPLTRTDPHLAPVRIVSIDGELFFDPPARPVEIYPGTHDVVLESTSTTMRIALQKHYPLKVEPCRRYFLAARRDASMQTDWSLVVDHEEVVAGCNPDDELRKAQIAAGKHT